MYVTCVGSLRGQRRVLYRQELGPRATMGGYQKQNSGPLQEQQALLAAEPSPRFARRNFQALQHGRAVRSLTVPNTKRG